jgi:hypothetical protein
MFSFPIHFFLLQTNIVFSKTAVIGWVIVRMAPFGTWEVFDPELGPVQRKEPVGNETVFSHAPEQLHTLPEFFTVQQGHQGNPAL